MPSRRERIKQGMGVSGGMQAPNGRRARIKKALANPSQTPPMRFPQVGGKAPRQGAPLRSPVNVGSQLRRRVQGGAISGQQAQTVARQRQLLQKAFGTDWRKQVFGAGGAKGLKASGPFGQGAVRAKRSQALQRAKRKLY